MYKINTKIWPTGERSLDETEIKTDSFLQYLLFKVIFFKVTWALLCTLSESVPLPITLINSEEIFDKL